MIRTGGNTEKKIASYMLPYNRLINELGNFFNITKTHKIDVNIIFFGQ